MRRLGPSPAEKIRMIQRVVAERYGIPVEMMSSPSREWIYSHPRQIAMRLAVEFTKRSPEIVGRRFGGRCRKTVTYAIQASKRRARTSAAERLEIADLRATIRNLPMLQK